MNALPLAISAAVLLLTGCVSADSAADSGYRWYNPLSWHWSALNPMNGSALTLSEQGVGGLTGATPMSETAVYQGLGGRYRLRKGMRIVEGNVVTFWQGMSENRVALEISGGSSVSKIVVLDGKISGPEGVKAGTPFSDLYSKAFGSCQKAGEDIRCQAPQSQHIWYQFHGTWHGPEGLLPDDATLKTWRLNKMIWQR